MSKEEMLRSLKDLFESTVTLHERISAKIENQLVTESLAEVNILIDAIVAIHKNLQTVLLHDPAPDLHAKFDEVADRLVDVIASFEENDAKKIENAYLGPFRKAFLELTPLMLEYFDNRTRKRIIIQGISVQIYNMRNLFDPKRAEVIAFLSTVPEHRGQQLGGIPIIAPEDLETIKYEYLVITDVDQTLFPENAKVIEVGYYFKYIFSHELYRALASFETLKGPLEAFVTGISYAQVGIDVQELSIPTVNLAVSSQDLYFDFEIVKCLDKKGLLGEQVKYAFIGLAYYSFQYDMSKGIHKNKLMSYYPYLGQLHHFECPQADLERLSAFDRVARDVISNDYSLTFYHHFKGEFDGLWDEMVHRVLNETTIAKAPEEARRDSNKKYPETVKENIQILTEYIEYLLARNIKPIFVVFPTSQHYHPHFAPHITEEFHTIIRQFQEKYEIPLIDGFNSELFGDDDFYETSHLNKQGAKKFTQMVEQVLTTL